MAAGRKEPELFIWRVRWILGIGFDFSLCLVFSPDLHARCGPAPFSILVIMTGKAILETFAEYVSLYFDQFSVIDMIVNASRMKSKWVSFLCRLHM